MSGSILKLSQSWSNLGDSQTGKQLKEVKQLAQAATAGVTELGFKLRSLTKTVPLSTTLFSLPTRPLLPEWPFKLPRWQDTFPPANQATLAQWFVRLSIVKCSKIIVFPNNQAGRREEGRTYIIYPTWILVAPPSTQVSKLHYHLKISHFSLLPTSYCLSNSENLSQTQSTPSNLHGHISVWKEYIGFGAWQIWVETSTSKYASSIA